MMLCLEYLMPMLLAHPSTLYKYKQRRIKFAYWYTTTFIACSIPHSRYEQNTNFTKERTDILNTLTILGAKH